MGSGVIQIMLSAARAQGLGAGKCPFGAYEGKVQKWQMKPIEQGKNEGLMGLNVWIDVTGGTNEEGIGRVITVYDVILQPEDVGEGKFIDTSTEDGLAKFDTLTSKLRRFLLATADTEEKSKAVATAKGKIGLDLDTKLATGTVIRLHYDPADNENSVEKKQYDDHRWLSASEYAKVREGKIRIPRVNSLGLTDDEAGMLGVVRKGKGDDQATAAARDRRQSRATGPNAATQATPAGGFTKGNRQPMQPKGDEPAMPHPKGSDSNDTSDSDENADAVQLVL
jgi:hypothetical protein